MSSYQPALFPWSGFWARFEESDVHVVLAGVGFRYGDYHNRVPFMGTWLTLPVVRSTTSGPIKDVKICGGALDRMLNTVTMALGGKRRRHGDRIRDVVADVRSERPSDYLVDVCLNCMRAAASALDLKTSVVLDEYVPEGLTKTDRFVSSVTRYVGKNVTYLAGEGTAGYVDAESLPQGFEVVVCRPNGGAGPYSILQVIAQNDDPMEYVREGFTWKNL